MGHGKDEAVQTKKVEGSPLARVLQRSWTWKEVANVATSRVGLEIPSPESQELEDAYRLALEAFEAIPDFPNDWEALQQRHGVLTQQMRALTDTNVPAKKDARDARIKLCKDARKEAESIASAVDQVFKGRAADALSVANVDLRDLLERLVRHGNADLDRDAEFVEQMAPVMQDLGSKVKLLDGLSSERRGELESFMSGKSMYVPELDQVIEVAKAELKRHERAKDLPQQWARFRTRACEEVPPPGRKRFPKLYPTQSDLIKACKVSIKLYEALTQEEARLQDQANEAAMHWADQAFSTLCDQVNLFCRMKKRLSQAEAEQKEKERQEQRQARKEQASRVIEEEDEEPVRMPVRRADPAAQRIIRIDNAALESRDALSKAEQDKVDLFKRLDGQRVQGRLRDTMNDVFGCYEVVRYHTIRISQRRRIEFTVDMETEGEIHLGLVNIGDPTYEH